MIITSVGYDFLAAALSSTLADKWRVALIRPNSAQVLDASTRYADLGADEIRGAGYVPGGQALRGARVERRGEQVCLNFEPARWPGADIYASGALLYNASRDAVGAVLDFGGVHAAVGGDTFVLPFDCPIRL